MSKTAIIYSYNTQKSKKVSEKIIEAFGKDKIEAINAEDITTDMLKKFNNFIIEFNFF